MRLAAKSSTNIHRPASFSFWGGGGFTCFLLSIFICANALASPTGLNIIPTADVLAHGEANIGIQLNGGPTSSGYQFFNQFQTQLGIGDNIEFGYDVSLGPVGGSFWNAKYLLFPELRRRPALAVGLLSNVGLFDNPLYITSFITDGQARIHAGLIQVDGTPRVMLGWELWHNELLMLQADYISGPRTYSSFGLVYNWPNGISINIAQQMGNSTSAANAYLVVLGWTGSVL